MVEKNISEKLVIMYHRSYRKLPGSLKSFFIQFFLLALPFFIITIVFYPEITKFVAECARYILQPHYGVDGIGLLSREFIKMIGPIYYIDIAGSFPGFVFSLINAIIAILVLIFLPEVTKFKPLVIFLVILSVIHVISSLFFIFIPYKFPYDATDYSQLYMIQEISIWFFIPILMGLAILPLPANIFLKLLILLFTFGYSIVFGIVRYAVFLYILSNLSMIYMAILFFALGPLIDFIYVVGIYSLFLNKLAGKLAEDYSIWRWQ